MLLVVVALLLVFWNTPDAEVPELPESVPSDPGRGESSADLEEATSLIDADTPVAVPPAPDPVAQDVVEAVVEPSLLEELPEPLLPPPSLGPDEVNEWVQEREFALDGLSSSDDPATLRELVSELRNPRRVLRETALESLEFRRDRAALPYLRELAANAPDAIDEDGVEDLIEFLELPTMTEVLEQMRANAANDQRSESNR